MKKNNRYPTNNVSKALLTLLTLFILIIACSKEHTTLVTPPPPPPPPPPVDTVVTVQVSLFSNDQVPVGFTQRDNTDGIEVGVKFQTTIAGTIAGVKFYKSSLNTGTHVGQLYTSSGTLLASEEFKNETDSGWQTVLFATPVPISANTTYIAAYHSSLGYYIGTNWGLKTAIVNAPLTALADSTEGRNGVFKYTNTPAVPENGYQSNNYWVDIIENIPKP
jgi:hypothetical protein